MLATINKARFVAAGGGKGGRGNARFKSARNRAPRRFDLGVKIDEFKSRKKVILTHIKNEKYPNLTDDEINALRAVAMHLYSSTKSLFDSSFELFKNVDSTLLKRR